MSAAIFLHSGDRKYRATVGRVSSDSDNKAYSPVTIFGEHADVSLFFGSPDNLREIACLLNVAALELEKVVNPVAAQSCHLNDPHPEATAAHNDLQAALTSVDDPSATIKHPAPPVGPGDLPEVSS